MKRKIMEAACCDMWPAHPGGRGGWLRRRFAMIRRGLLIGGKELPAAAGRTILVRSPATGQPIAEVAVTIRTAEQGVDWYGGENERLN
ncbi:MAG: hypothetical protein LBI49_16275 [Nocardiopsaceae bacterium]|nr:hypothetical protein [Nocardiopsaceae bacterium]